MKMGETAIMNLDTTGGKPRGEPPFRRDALAPYAQPHLGRSLLDIATSVVPYVALSVLMYLALEVSYLLVLALAVPAAGFLLRTFIIFHDCAHGSFLSSRRANAWLGAICGLLVFTGFQRWRHEHAVHTPRPETWIGAGSGTSRRSPSPSTRRCPGGGGSRTASFATRW
jgi:Fatty acid desaturase